MQNNEHNYKNEAVTLPADQALIKFTHIIYALQALGHFTFITWIVAIILNYVKKDDVKNTWLETHFQWQIRTFWYGLAWYILGTLTFVFIIGYFILVANLIWVIYRIIKGWLRLSENKEMYTEQPD